MSEEFANISMFISPVPHVPLHITKSQKTCCSTAQESYEICNEPVGNKILNIKPCISQISGTWELLLVDTCHSTWTHYSDSESASLRSYSLVLRA